MKLFTTLAVTSAAALLSGYSASSQAQAEVKIEWQNPEEYRDVRPANESRKGFRERTFKQIEAFITEELADKLPDGQVLSMTVTNLDLAGEVWPASFVGVGSGGSDVRLIKAIDIPRIKFSYTLTDANGDILKQGEENLKDMGFQDSVTRRTRNDALRYEKNMLDDWFKDTFPETIAKR